jgi:hypothetical protein
VEKQKRKEIQIEIVENSSNSNEENKKYSFSELEIKVTINEEEKTHYPVIMSIKYFTQLNIVIFKIESNKYLNDRNVFQFLINNEIGQLIFNSPGNLHFSLSLENETERSINHKFVFYHFIQNIAKSVTNEKYNEIVTIREFFEKLKQRIENHIRME